jgi:lactoylglutathione lyase
LIKKIHTRFRVSDMGQSVQFYKDVLGMEVLGQKTSPSGSMLVFLRFPFTDCELELCSFPGSGKTEVPEDLAHLAFEEENLDNCIFKLEHSRIPNTEGPIKTSNGTHFIFTEDPDKYAIELMQHSK